MLNISQVILLRTDSNLCRKEITVHWSAPNYLIRSYPQPSTNSMWEDESEAMAPFIWLYQTVDAQKLKVFFLDLLITLRRYVCIISSFWCDINVACYWSMEIQDDVIKWKHFRRNWPIVQGIHRSQRTVTQSFDLFFDLRPNKRLSKQSWGWWIETPSRSL